MAMKKISDCVDENGWNIDGNNNLCDVLPRIRLVDLGNNIVLIFFFFYSNIIINVLLLLFRSTI